MLKQRLRDLALEILIGTVLVGGFVFYLFEGDPVNGPLVAAVLNTAVVFGFLISWFRAVWTEPRFWLLLFATLILHAAAYFELWRRTGLKFPAANFMFINMIELALFFPVLARLMTRSLGPSSDSNQR